MMLHGGDIYSVYANGKAAPGALLDFSANISPLGIPDGVRNRMIGELENARHYPDPNYRRLKGAIAAKLDGGQEASITPDMICCGNGAADVIYRLVLARRPKTALLAAPTFAEYEEALRLVDTRISFYNCPADTLSIEADILDLIVPELDIMFLCNPNNPTGLLTDSVLLDQIIEKTKACGVFLVVDECFLDFCEDEHLKTVVRKLSQNRHILVLKSFTKMFAIPGVRLGYGVCADTQLIRRMERCGQSWPVSTLAESAGLAALLEDTYKIKVRDYIRQERAFLSAGFQALGIRYFESQANYMLLHMAPEIHLYDRLLEMGILIRRCGNYRNLDESYYRVAVNSHEDNVRLLKALEVTVRPF